MANEVLTSPLALIKIGGAVVGKARNVRVTENFRRGRVVGLGEINPSELPVLDWAGTLTCSLYAIKLNTGVLGAVDRSMANVQEFVQSLLFNEGIQFDLLMKKKQGTTIVPVTFASVKGAHITSEGFDISEGQISGRDASFEYIDPILYG